MTSQTTKGPGEPNSAPVIEQFMYTSADKGAPIATLSASTTSVPSSSQPCSRVCAKNGSRALHKQSSTLHISPMKVATFYSPKAESTSFLMPSYSMLKCTKTHWMLMPLKWSQSGKTITATLSQIKMLQITTDPIVQKSVHEQAFTFLQNLSIIIIFRPDLLSNT